MDDKNNYNGFVDDLSDLFADLDSFAEDNARKKASQKGKFVLHIDDDTGFDIDEFLRPDEKKAETRKTASKITEDDNSAADGKNNSYSGSNGAKLAPVKERKETAPKPEKRREVINRNTVKRNVKPEETDKTPVQKNHEPAKTGKEPAKTPADSQKRVVRMRTRSASASLTRFIVFLVCVAVISTLLTLIGLSAIDDILAYDKNETSVTVVIDNAKNSDKPSYDSVVDALHDAGLIKQKTLCKLFGKYRHFDGYTDKDNKYHEVEYVSGVYYLEAKMGFEGMLNTIKASSSTNVNTVTLTFPEGWTATQIFEKLEKNGVCEKSKLYANLETVAKQFDFYYDIDITDIRYLGLEGYLFPDTYEFYKGENAVSVLKKLFENFEVKWTKAYEKRANALKFSRDEILNIAAIIQREAANQSQMADISAVIHNRLKSSTYPSLQCNSTLDYITNFVKSQVDSGYAQIYADAYNTYKCEGLPPGPICNPGIDAIEAALYPSDTNYYFFVHNNEGKIYLSETYSQFQQDCVQVALDNK